MLSNAYLLPKFRFDTAENEPAKNLQSFAKFNFAKFANFADPNPGHGRAPDDAGRLPQNSGRQGQDANGSAGSARKSHGGDRQGTRLRLV